jgi:hypothetical protein
MPKYLWAIIVFLLHGLVICGVAWVFQALFGYPGGRYQGHGAPCWLHKGCVIRRKSSRR